MSWLLPRIKKSSKKGDEITRLVGHWRKEKGHKKRALREEIILATLNYAAPPAIRFSNHQNCDLDELMSEAYLSARGALDYFGREKTRPAGFQSYASACMYNHIRRIALETGGPIKITSHQIKKYGRPKIIPVEDAPHHDANMVLKSMSGDTYWNFKISKMADILTTSDKERELFMKIIFTPASSAGALCGGEQKYNNFLRRIRRRASGCGKMLSELMRIIGILIIAMAATSSISGASQGSGDSGDSRIYPTRALVESVGGPGSMIEYTKRETLDSGAPWFAMAEIDKVRNTGRRKAHSVEIISPQNIPLADMVDPGDIITLPVAGTVILKFKYWSPVAGWKDVIQPPIMRVAQTVYSPPEARIGKDSRGYFIELTGSQKAMFKYLNEVILPDGSKEESQALSAGSNQQSGRQVRFYLRPRSGEWMGEEMLLKVEYTFDDPVSGKKTDVLDILFKPEKEIPAGGGRVADGSNPPSGGSTDAGKAKAWLASMRIWIGLAILAGALIYLSARHFNYGRKWFKKKPVEFKEDPAEDAKGASKPPLAGSDADPESAKKVDRPKRKALGDGKKRMSCPFEFYFGRESSQSDSADPDCFAIPDSRGFLWYLCEMKVGKGSRYKFSKQKTSAVKLPEGEKCFIGWDQFHNTPTLDSQSKIDKIGYRKITSINGCHEEYPFKIKGKVYYVTGIEGENKTLTGYELTEDPQKAYKYMLYYYEVVGARDGSIIVRPRVEHAMGSMMSPVQEKKKNEPDVPAVTSDGFIDYNIGDANKPAKETDPGV